MTLQTEEGTWIPTIKFTDAVTNGVITSGISIDYHNIGEAGSAKGDCYGNYTRIGKRVFLDFCLEFTMTFSGLSNPCIIMVNGLPYRPSCVGEDPDSSVVTTSGTGLGVGFISNHSRFSAGVLPSFSPNMCKMDLIATPFFNALHFEGLENPSGVYGPRLLTTNHFISGSRRYIRGEVNYITAEDFI